MKNKVVVSICAFLLVLMVVPAINFKNGKIHNNEKEKWWSKAILYNVDFALPYLSRLLYPLGISINSELTIIGKNNWLYLGDKGTQNNNNVTFSRIGATYQDVTSAKETEYVTALWSQWLKLHGVRMYKIMLGPNKESIYPEFLPDWMRPAAESKIDTLFYNDAQDFYFDSRPALRAAKSQYAEPLYYRTDAHWNSLGAWVAFRAFAQDIGRKDKGLRWLPPEQVRVVGVSPYQIGDLASYIRMPPGLLRDEEVSVKIAGSYPIQMEWYDYDTGNRKIVGGITEVDAALGTAWEPLIIKSKNALNQKKVLWLCDSFGQAMAPYMSATFSETLHLHYASAIMSNGQFAKLVKAYKPDYVFVTVVERIVVQRTTLSSIGAFFISSPPVDVASDNGFGKVTYTKH